MYSRYNASSSSASYSNTQAAASVRRRGSFAVEADGLLLQRGAQLRRESCDDKFRKIENSRARLEMQLTRGHAHEGKFMAV